MKSPTHPVMKGTLDELISSDSQSGKLLDSLGSFSPAECNSPLAGVCILCSCKHGQVRDVIQNGVSLYLHLCAFSQGS